MNKRELIDAVATRIDLDRVTAEAALDAVFGTVTTALVLGDKVAIPGFGTFETRRRAARAGRNPQTGEPIDIAASTAAAFKPATALRQAVNTQT